MGRALYCRCPRLLAPDGAASRRPRVRQCVELPVPRRHQRLLGPSDYGALAALLAVVLVFSIPLGVIQTAVADKTATLRSVGRDDDVRPLAASALKTTAPFAYASGIAVALVACPLLSVFLHVDFASALLLAPYVVASVPASVAQGVLQGEQRFVRSRAFRLRRR